MKNIVLPVLIVLFITSGFGCAKEDVGVAVVEKIVDIVEDKPVTEEAKDPNIIISSPELESTSKSPIHIEGQARTFESEIEYNLLTPNEKIIDHGVSITDATDLYEFGSFEFDILYPPTDEEFLYVDVFWTSPRNGLEMDLVRLKVYTLKEEPKTTVKVYFADPGISEYGSCGDVDFEKRTVEKTVRVGELAIREMLKGPESNWAESSIPEGTKFESLKVEDGLATLYLDYPDDYQFGGACLAATVQAQIEETLMQFPTVQEVEIFIDGENDVLEP